MTPRPHHSLHSPFKIPSHPYPNQSSVPLDCFPYCNDTSLIKISPHHFNWCRVYSCLKTHITAWINLQRIMLSEKKSIPIILYNCKQTFLKWHEKRGTDEWLPRVKDRMCVGVQESGKEELSVIVQFTSHQPTQFFISFILVKYVLVVERLF